MPPVVLTPPNGNGNRAGDPARRTLRNPLTPYVIGGSWGGFSSTGGYVAAEAFDDIVNQFGTRVYELMGYDSAVASATILLKAGILAEGPQLKPAVRAAPGEIITKRKRQQEIKVAGKVMEQCERSLYRLPSLNATLSDVLDALRFGCSLAEMTFELIDEAGDPDTGSLLLKSLRNKPRWAYLFRVNALYDILAVRAWTTEGWADVDRRKFLILSWYPRDGDPRGTSAYQAAYGPFNIKLQVYPNFGEYLLHFADPGLILTAGTDQVSQYVLDPATQLPVEQNVLRMLVDAGIQFRGRKVMALPMGSTANLLESKGTGDAYLNGFAYLDREIFRSIILSTRPIVESQHGSKADSESGLDLFALAIERGREPLRTAIEDDLLYQQVLLNHGKAIADRYTPEVDFGQSNHVKGDLMTAFSAAWNSGILDPQHLPWIWDTIGAPRIDPSVMEQRQDAKQDQQGQDQQGQQQGQDNNPNPDGGTNPPPKQTPPAGTKGRGGTSKTNQPPPK